LAGELLGKRSLTISRRREKNIKTDVMEKGWKGGRRLELALVLGCFAFWFCHHRDLYTDGQFLAVQILSCAFVKNF
jgi:hypothetical protein